MDLYDPYMVPHTIHPRGIIILQAVLTKFNFLTKFPHLEIKFPHLEKIVNLMKDHKYEHQSKIKKYHTFPLWGRVKFNFRDRYRKPNIYSKNSSCYQIFSSYSQKMTL